MNKLLIIIVIIIALGGGWWFISQNKSTTSSSQQSMETGKLIEIKDFKYAPGTLTVKAGEKITVTNKDAAGHSVTADDGSFDSGVLGKDVSGSITAPSKPGTYKFHCIPHPSIQGTLIVE